MSLRSGLFKFGSFTFDFTNNVLLDGKEVTPLKGKNLDVLKTLVIRRGHYVSTEELLKHWGTGDQNSVHQAIKAIRDALGETHDSPRYVETRKGFGFRFIYGRRTLAIVPFRDNLHQIGVHDPLLDGSNVAMEVHSLLASCVATDDNFALVSWIRSYTAIKNVGDNTPAFAEAVLADILLHGNIVTHKSSITVYLELEDQAGNSIGQSTLLKAGLEQYQSNSAELFERIVTWLAKELSLSLKKRPLGIYMKTTDPDTRRLYIDARQYLNKRDNASVARAISLFRQVLERDPKYSPAYAGLADSYITRVTNEFAPTSLVMEAEQNARRAIELDEIAEAHVSLGLINGLHRYEWLEAERHFQKALSIKRSADTLNYYCLRLLLSLRRFTEAETIAKEAYGMESDIEKDRTPLAATLYFSERYSESIEECKRMIDLDGDRWVTYTWLGTAYTHAGDYDLAVNTYKKAMELEPSSVDFVSGWLAYTHILAGRPDLGQKELKRLLHVRRARQQYVSPYTIAVIYNGLENPDEALEWLSVGYDERIGRMARLAVDPFFANLRSNTRFRSLLAKLNLENVR